MGHLNMQESQSTGLHLEEDQAETHTIYLQGLPLPQGRMLRMPMQGIPIEEAGRQQALHRRAPLAVRVLWAGLFGQQQTHQVWSSLICCHVDGPRILVIPSEELACSTGGVHRLAMVGVSQMCYYWQESGVGTPLQGALQG